MNKNPISFINRLRGLLRRRIVASPVGTLLLFVQRSPLVKMLLPETKWVATAGFAEITTWSVATVAGLGAYDAVSGATTITQLAPNAGSNTVDATVGTNLSFVFQLVGYPDTPGSWRVTGLPGGLTHADAKNNTVDSVSGAPTQAGTFSIDITAYKGTGYSGDRFTKTFVMNVRDGGSPEIVVEQPSGTGLVDGTSAVAFRSTTVGESSSRIFTIRNTGTAQLTGLSASISGSHSADFAAGAFGASSIAPGGSTTVTVTFSPRAAGNRTAALHIASNDSNENPFDIDLSGSGLSAVPEMNVRGNNTSIPDNDTTPALADHTDFGSAPTIGATVVRTFTILNTGTAALNLSGTPRVVVGGSNAADFVVTTQPTASVAAGGSTTFQVQFDPSASGTRTATLSIANNDANENPYNFTIKGTGILAPLMDVLGNNILIADGDASPVLGDHTDFGAVSITGNTMVRTFTIRNRGAAALNLTGTTRVVVGGTNAADFRVTTQPAASVPVGGTTTFQVTFDPAATGLRTATLSLANNDAARNPYNFSIKGTGTAPEMNVLGNARDIMDGDLWPGLTDHTDFGSASVSSGTVVRTFTIQNTGTAALSLSGTPRVVVGGTNAADFVVTTQPTASVAAGGSTTFQVRFDPSAAGTRTATLSIANNDANENPYNFNIKGAGLASIAAVASVGTASLSTDGIPMETTPGEVWIDGNRYLTLTVAKPSAVMDFMGTVEVSGNLTDWFSGPSHTTILRDDANLLKVRDNTPITPAIKRYIRIR